MKSLEMMPYQSPIGMMDVILDGDILVCMDFSDNPERSKCLLTRRFGQIEMIRSSHPTPVHHALDRYFSHGGDPFHDLRLDTGGTPFQSSVWCALRQIPPGETIDYSTLARKVGNPKAIRAAASCNARNPISIIIPCHRVIGRDGSLRGYAGGQERKRWLIQHEQRCLKDNIGELSGTRRLLNQR